MLRGFVLRTRGCGSCWPGGTSGSRGRRQRSRCCGAAFRASAAGRGPGGPGRPELTELLEAAVVGRPGEAVTEVAAREVWAQAGPAERPAGGDDAAHGPSLIRGCGTGRRGAAAAGSP